MNKTIKIAYDPDFAPFSFLKEGKASGIVIDRIRKIFKAAHIEFEFIPLELTQLGKALMAGDVDMLAVMAVTKARADIYSFSKTIITSGGAWFITKNNQPLYDDQLPKVAITPKTGPLVSQIKNLFPEIELITCEDYDGALKAVLAKDADGAALNWHVGRMLVDDRYAGLFHIPTAPFNNITLAMATKAGDPDNILEQLNAQIDDDLGPDPL